GLFTQGMVTHETYSRGDAGDAQPETDTDDDDSSDAPVKTKWLSPDEVRKTDAGYIEIATGGPVTVGRVTKMSKSKKNT
ncbi:hypothetical protein AB2C69_34575, partial [Pseudomonas aeruginosa]